LLEVVLEKFLLMFQETLDLRRLSHLFELQIKHQGSIELF